MPTLKQLFGTASEPSELANYGISRGLQADSQSLRNCELGELGGQAKPPSSHGSQGSPTTKWGYGSINIGLLASSQSSLKGNAQSDAANEGESEESKLFWSNLIDRINWCDLLIHELCDIRGDDQARRDDLILTRQRTSPVNVDSDIRYLLGEIERVSPTPSLEPIRDCRDCEHHRGRNNNAARYCVSPDGAAQRDDALASVILDCSISTRCDAFTRTAASPRGRRMRAAGEVGGQERVS